MTPEQLQAATSCTQERAYLFAPHLTVACETYLINTPKRLAAFLAQIGHESGALRYLREIWGPTEAQLRYEGRKDLGNTEPGDGQRYLGRGLIQTTGRFNYARTRDALRKVVTGVPDFEAEPQALEEPYWAAMSAAQYWDSRTCNALADAGDFEGITRKINGGLNGQPDRLARWARAAKALGAAPMPQTPEPEKPMLPALIPSLFTALSGALPNLVKLIRPESEAAQRNAQVSAEVLKLATSALGAANAQEAVERVQADPAAADTVRQAVEDNWFQLVEAGGGGIEGARQADTAFVRSGEPVWGSPSFIALLLLTPLVYLLVLSLIGVIGTAQWSDDVRAGLAGSLISAIIGGAVGYYWGQTTSRNRTPQ